MTVIHSLQMQQNNILTTGFPEGYFVKEISFQDMNHDNNDDLILILENIATNDDKEEDKSNVAMVFVQSDAGIFEFGLLKLLYL